MACGEKMHCSWLSSSHVLSKSNKVSVMMTILIFREVGVISGFESGVTLFFHQ